MGERDNSNLPDGGIIVYSFLLFFCQRFAKKDGGKTNAIRKAVDIVVISAIEP